MRFRWNLYRITFVLRYKLCENIRHSNSDLRLSIRLIVKKHDIKIIPLLYTIAV